MRPENERLLRLARILREHGTKTAKVSADFDMSDWVRGDSGVEGENFCPTACCALGLAAIHPDFPELGVRITCGIAVLIVNDKPSTWTDPLIRNFFGINIDESNSLFSPATYTIDGKPRSPDIDPEITPEDVIDRIREMLAKRGVHLTTQLEAA